MANSLSPYLEPAAHAGMVRVSAPEGIELVDLSLNESSWGPPPGCIPAVTARAGRLERYPDPASTELRRALSRVYGLDPVGIVCGNGSEELLDCIVRAFAREGDEVVYPEHGFAQFRMLPNKTGAVAVKVPEQDYRADVDGLIGAVTTKTRVMFLANPNNPTGTWLPKEDIGRLVDAVPDHVVLVLDAAYGEYCTDPDFSYGHEFVDGRDNVVVTRTFSKAWGLASLRVGWAHGTPWMISVLNRFRGVGNVNALAQESALAALDDPDFLDRVVAETAVERDRVSKSLGQLGFRVTPSVCNFVLAHAPEGAPDAAAIAKDLLERCGVAVNPLGIYDLPGGLRIGIGLPDENARLLEGLRSVLSD